MDATRHALSGMLLALAVPIGLVAGALIGLLLAVALHVRVLLALGKLLGCAAGRLAKPLARTRWSLGDIPAAPATLALPPRR
jgi:hypothetical protein